MNFLAIIGIALLVLGILVIVSVVPGGIVVGVIALLVGVALLAAGSGRFVR